MNVDLFCESADIQTIKNWIRHNISKSYKIKGLSKDSNNDKCLHKSISIANFQTNRFGWHAYNTYKVGLYSFFFFFFYSGVHFWELKERRLSSLFKLLHN